MDVSFSQAILRLPASTLNEGLSEEPHENVNIERAFIQHKAYQQALKESGLELTILPALNAYPDSCFVEDMAIVTDSFAVMTRSGAPSRRGESTFIEPAIQGYFKDNVYYISEHGTLDGGDILQYKQQFFIGLSGRTNYQGALELQKILNENGYQATIVNVSEFLHLKSSVSYLGENTFLVTKSLSHEDWLQSFDKIILDEEESYAANAVRVNGNVIIASGYSKLENKLCQRGFNYLSVDTSEFKKVDGGLSCLSLRF